MPHHDRPRPAPLTVGPVTLDFSRPALMGVVNTTPDSFSDGGRFADLDAAVRHAEQLVADGAAILDIGGESTRPGAEGIDAESERQRVLPLIAALVARRVPAPISIDTAKAAVADAALAAGATMVNDVTALADPEMAGVVARHGAALVVMHMRGTPRTMQQGEIVYRDLIGEVSTVLAAATAKAIAAGVPAARILIDPGIGFGKTVAHNLELTRRLGELAPLDQAIVYGPSRKSFLGAVTGRPVDDRDRATAAACVAAVLAGAHVLRVHDVAAVRDAVAVAAALAPPVAAARQHARGRGKPRTARP